MIFAHFRAFYEGGIRIGRSQLLVCLRRSLASLSYVWVRYLTDGGCAGSFLYIPAFRFIHLNDAIYRIKKKLLVAPAAEISAANYIADSRGIQTAYSRIKLNPHPSEID